MHWEPARWPADEWIDAHILVHDWEASRSFAFVSIMPTNFHYRLELELLDMQF